MKILTLYAKLTYITFHLRQSHGSSVVHICVHTHDIRGASCISDQYSELPSRITDTWTNNL